MYREKFFEWLNQHEGTYKFIEDDYKQDLNNLIDYYKEKGHRDARVVSDTVISSDNEIDVQIKVVHLTSL